MKDEKIFNLYKNHGVNIASFASFSPDGKLRHWAVFGVDKDSLSSIEDAVTSMLESGIPYVNIRSFTPDKPDGNPFLLGKKHGFNEVEPVVKAAQQLMEQGYHVIINENIDADDGGFSGVVQNNTVEFAWGETPRCVESESDTPCAKHSLDQVRSLVKTVYNIDLTLPDTSGRRIEFSVHPNPSGCLKHQVTIWQINECSNDLDQDISLAWPNRYSRALGDKAYGLVMADMLGCNVPVTTVFGRNIPPFTFGRSPKNSDGVWLRTAPAVLTPGKYTTCRGWVDPYALLSKEDPKGSAIASVLAQTGISADYSGSAICSGWTVSIEGVSGYGDKFMTGSQAPEALPELIIKKLNRVAAKIKKSIINPRFEWVIEKNTAKVWIVQLHSGSGDYGTKFDNDRVFPGDPVEWVEFKWGYSFSSLEDLRDLCASIANSSKGILLLGNVGVTSHPADILRQYEIPSKIVRQ